MRKKRYNTGGGIDPYSMIAAQATQMIGDYSSAFNYKPQLGPEKSQKDYNREIIQKGLTQGVLGAIPAIIRMNKDKNTVVSGGPGTYQQGGPIKGSNTRIDTSKRVLRQPIVPAVPIIQTMPQIDFLNPFPLDPMANVIRSVGEPGSSKSKSKNRFREKAMGGPVDPPSKEKPLQFLGRSINYSTDPIQNVEDERYYDHMSNRFIDVPELSGEAGRGKMSFGMKNFRDFNTVYDPYQDKLLIRNKWSGTYQIAEGVNDDKVNDRYEQVAKIKAAYRDKYKSRSATNIRNGYAMGGQMGDQQLSNSSFQVKDNPNVTDGKTYPEYNARLDHNEVVDADAKFVFSDDLKLGDKSFASLAKPLYKSVGKLENRKDPISMATKQQLDKQINDLAMTQEQLATMLGLRDDESTGYATGGPLPWEGFGVKEFQKWAASKGYVDPATGKPLSADGKWGPATENAFKAIGQPFAQELGLTNIGGEYKRTSPLRINNNPQGMSIASDNQFLDVDVNRPTWMPPTGIQNKPVYIDTPEGQVDISQLDGVNVPRRAETARDRATRIGFNPLPTPEPQTGTLTTPTATTPDPNFLDSLMNGFTAGDIMQGVEVGSKFFNIGEGAETEGQLMNTSPITKTGYDVNPALYQNQRNFQNTVNSIGTASPNTRRAVINNLYANKLNADNQIMTNYQNMNNEATINYENRISQQRQGNIASAFRTNDLNAANRGLYDQAQQNAFTSVGNFGEALNRRKVNRDILGILRNRYPDVYKNVMGE